MSFQAMAWAIKLKLPTREKFVLLMLANYASNDKGDCYPSLARLAEDTGMVNNTVIAAIQKLEEMGALTVQRRKMDGVNLPNVYRLNLGWGGSAPDALPVHLAQGGSAPDAHKPIIEPITQKKESVRVIWNAQAERLEVPESLARILHDTYGARTDVAQEIAKADAWLRLNPTRRPKRDFGRFLNGWISRAAERRVDDRRTPTKTERREAFMEGLFGPAGGSNVIVDVDATVVR
jgi:hypothetical protein